MTHAYSCTRNETTGHAPFYLMFGCHLNLPINLMFGFAPDNQKDSLSYDKFVDNLREHLRSSYRAAQNIIDRPRVKQKQLYDRESHNAPPIPGDHVLVLRKHITGTQKLADRWEPQPYVVVSKHGNLPVYIVASQETGKERTLH
ncbi:uncharacterized protein LOC110984005 [Acanthaster planci]|uniref:Uncharacterized protein LOC110984005 n=1 Tax=Acanthaster planci TaxID=133434 RepID=A0A8B7Z3D9_ACAPL|nr:uncharacterized protein LOC110984005 [Acanthaster planci]